ncbi:MAG: hypothetical protein IKE75_04280 [Bacilli bacterium]|nr:hypothetical protein [Bacilli bacterium]
MKISSQRDKRNYLIMALCAILVIMGVGYASFSSLLTINGTANISNSWCVGFDNTRTSAMQITKGLSTGTTPTGSMSYSGTACGTNLVPTSSLVAHFYQPGDQIEYTLTITNKSTVTAAIKSILVDNESVTSDTTKKKDNITYIIEMPESTTLAPNASTTMKVTAKFQNETDVTGPYSGETKTIEVKINAEQDDGSGGMVVNNSIPSEYQELEYIMSTGTQYINTEVRPSNTLNVDIVYTDNSASGSNYVLGSRTDQNSTIIYAISGAQATSAISVSFMGNTKAFSLTRVSDKKYLVHIQTQYVSNYGYRLYAQLNDLTLSNSYNEYTQYYNNEISNNLPYIYVFAFNSSNIHRGMSLYSLKFWDNNSLIKNLIPCYRKSDNVAGLYDTISDTFLTNAGTGSFIEGPEV